jgi:hypothetical protein
LDGNINTATFFVVKTTAAAAATPDAISRRIAFFFFFLFAVVQHDHHARDGGPRAPQRQGRMAACDPGIGAPFGIVPLRKSAAAVE